MASVSITNDQALQGDVSDELLYTPDVDAHLIVVAHDGLVTLAGTVDSLAERQAAQRTAERVWGVTSVEDAMSVRPTADLDGGDADATRTARQLLDWAVTIEPGTVQVDVLDRVLTLTGTVTWAYQREAAVRAVSDMRGITAIRDDITVAEQDTVSVMQGAVEASIRRNAPLDAGAITVHVDGHDLTLDGTVRSAAERQQAEQVAWAAAGVATVHNALRITA